VPVRKSWREARLADHFVQFYSDEAVLLESVAGFLAAGLRTVEGGIVLATAAHRQELEARLESQGIDLGAARARRQYVPHDAAEILARFMVNGLPDEKLFNQIVGDVVLPMLSAGFRVRVFGEMGALLWANGNSAAAIRLEELWHALGRTHRFAVFCAYPMAPFMNGADTAGFRHVCAMHQGVIPGITAGDGLSPASPAG
jgi:hypothetical protein